MVNASPSVEPEANLRNHILSILRNVHRDLENFPSIDPDTADYASYRLERIASLAINSRREWPNIIDDETINFIQSAFQMLENGRKGELEPVMVMNFGKSGRPSVNVPK